jgi:hypothetical protein
MVSRDDRAPEGRLEFEVTGADCAALVDAAHDQIRRFLGDSPRHYRIGWNAYPCVSSADGQILRWRGEITVTIDQAVMTAVHYPRETTR